MAGIANHREHCDIFPKPTTLSYLIHDTSTLKHVLEIKCSLSSEREGSG